MRSIYVPIRLRRQPPACIFRGAAALVLFFAPFFGVAQEPEKTLTALPKMSAPSTPFYVDFRKNEALDGIFKLIGPDAINRIKTEPEGLRITLPAEQDLPRPVGLITTRPIKGDYEITVGYEIIDAPRPRNGNGVGLEFFLQTNTATKEAVAFYRMMRTSGRDVYSAAHMTTSDQGKLNAIRPPDMPAAGHSGNMRITRVGAKVVLSAAAEIDKEFRVLYCFDLDSDDVELLRLTANPGNAANPVDLRLFDLTVRDVDPQARDRLAANDASSSPRREALWWLIGMFLTIFAIGVLWIWRRKRRGKRLLDS